MNLFETLSSIFMLGCSVLGITCSLIFASAIIILRRHCTPIVLVSFNTTIAGLIVNIIYASQAIHQMISDKSDILCIFRGFMLHTSTGLFYHTLFIQALYRLFVTVFSQQQYLRSKRFIVCIVIIQWIISCTFSIPILLMERIKFQGEGRICQVSFNDIFGFMYMATFIYLLPYPVIIIIYIAILKHTKRSVCIATVRQRILEKKRHRRELQRTRRILIHVVTLFITGFPYIGFFLDANIKPTLSVAYGYRISFMFIAFGQGIVMLFTMVRSNDVKKTILKTLS